LGANHELFYGVLHGNGKKPVLSIVEQSSTVMRPYNHRRTVWDENSTVIPISNGGRRIMASYYLAGVYGVAIAAAA
jgi:Na+/H+-translocating membrane pyrophosphatase